MANDTRCVFCGKSINPFRSTNVFCGKTHEPSCRDCAREMESLPHIDRCRRALQRGLANHPELLREYIEVTQSAEEHRPTCGRFAFFHPETVRSNPFLAHLIEKDTGRT